MKIYNGAKTLKNSTLFRVWASLLSLLIALCICCTAAAVIIETAPVDPRAQLKARLMYQIQNEGWDPYSEDMSVDEFYALMELFDEGKLPIDDANTSGKKTAKADAVDKNDATTYIPREKFMYQGLPDAFFTNTTENEDDGTNLQLPYDNAKNYELSDPQGNYIYVSYENGLLTTDDGLKFQRMTFVEYWENLGKTEEEIPDDKKDSSRYVLVLVEIPDGVSGYTQDDVNTLFLEMDRLSIKYPEGLDVYSYGYRRPAKSWEGVPVRDSKTLRAVVVLEEENADRRISSNVDQTLFQEYDNYYIRQLTIDGADINILGMIQVSESRCVYYYLSAAGQTDQVSTTTLGDNAKFIVEYVPHEHTVDYIVAAGTDVYDGNGSLNASKIEGLISAIGNEDNPGRGDYVTDAALELNPDVTLGSIFGATRSTKTTEGAYSFNVVAPYGYTTRIFICITMSMTLTPPDEEEAKTYSFNVHVDHTDKLDEMAWLNPFFKCLKDAGFLKDINDVNAFKNSKISNEGTDGAYGWTWVEGDEGEENVAAFNAILERMNERLNAFTLHNDGFPLGTYPDYVLQGDTLVPSANGPTGFLWSDTFYNHDVRANRTIVAVLEKLPAPTFDIHDVILTDNAGGTGSGRGSSATEAYAKASLDPHPNTYDKDGNIYHDKDGNVVPGDRMDEDYKFHKDNGSGEKNPNDPFTNHGSVYPNVASADGWKWSNNGHYFTKPVNMWDNGDGTYDYAWVFQTNSGEVFLLDALAINGVAVSIPFYPKYVYGNYNFANASTNYDEEPWQEMTILPDGSKVYVEMLVGFNNVQCVYRIRIVGARANVTVTAINIMQYGSGSPEFSVYKLEGVYADAGNKNQTAPAIEYHGVEDKNIDKGWKRHVQGQIVVSGNNYSVVDSSKHGANIRFKIVNGYGDPYYIWRSSKDGVIANQTSVQLDAAGNLLKNSNGDYLINEVRTFDGLSDSDLLDSQYIYNGGDGWYYIRVTTQSSYRMVTLTIVARTNKYLVRYIPSYYYLDQSDTENTYASPDGIIGVVNEPENLPVYVHNDKCDKGLYDAGELGQQYDDNLGTYYDLLQHNRAAIPSDLSGAAISPRDPNVKSDVTDVKKYTFVDWVLVGKDFLPIRANSNGELLEYIYNSDGQVANKQGEAYDADVLALYPEIHYKSGAIDLTAISEFAVHVTQFSTEERDLYVVRLMPVWKVIDNPFHYDVILNWIDTLGNIHAVDFSNDWNVVTEAPLEDSLYVFINKEAGPLHDWISNHPTYTFWDAVNNVVDDDSTSTSKIETALKNYLTESSLDDDAYNNLLSALTGGKFIGITQEADPEKGIPEIREEHEGYGGFKRLGRDTFAVLDDGARICIWMFEDKGGLIFHKDVEQEAFTPDDEFYFTVSNATVGSKLLEGNYKAYPQFVYDENGNPREFVNADAWIISFKNGGIEQLKKDGAVLYELDEKGEYILNEKQEPIPITYFTLKGGDGIQLYVPDGKYTVVELGSKSGGVYKTDVSYSGDKDKMDGEWDIPDTDQWVSGSEKQVYDSAAFPKGVSQISATVNFKIGENNVVQVITFTNKTASLSLSKSLRGVPEELQKEYYDFDFQFKIKLTLPTLKDELANLKEDYTPLVGNNEDNTEYYYFNMTVYRSGVNDIGEPIVIPEATKIILTQVDKENNIWEGIIVLKADETAVIIMHVADDNQIINYTIDELSEIKNSFSDKKDSNGNYLNSTLREKELTDVWTNRTGTASAGKKTSAKVINQYGEIPEPEYGYIKITVVGGKSTESFLFKITDKEDDTKSITVSVKGNGTTYVFVPVGTYVIEEIGGWSWRYNVEAKTETEVTVENDDRTQAVWVSFDASSNGTGWLGGESSGDKWLNK